MKDKFMLSRTLICSAPYLRLSPSAQALYVALNADADDDGIVEAFAVTLRQRATENDLIQLIENNFLVLIDKTNMLVWLRHWISNNSNRDSRYIKPSQHRQLLAQIVPTAEVFNVSEINGKKTRELIPVANALSRSNTIEYNNQTRRFPTHKTSTSQDKFNTCLDYSTYNCPYCNGTGKCGNEICSHCHGTGEFKIKSERSDKK